MKTRSVLLWIALAALLSATTVAAAGNRPATAEADFAAIDAFIASEMKRGGIPGLSLAIVQDGRVLYQNGYGRADRSGRAVTPQTPFIIGSIGKTFTALAIRQLAHSGRLELDAPVQRYVPYFTLSDPADAARITVAQLLNHTSGIPQSAGEQAHQLDPQYTTAELVRRAAGVALNRPPGAAYEYCNVNYLLLGLVVEAVAGQSYTSYVAEHIWQPLGMSHTTFSETAAQAGGLATGYRTFYGLRLPAQAPFPPGMLPSGYAISTAEDLAHYVMAYLDKGYYAGASLLYPAGSESDQSASVTAYDTYWAPITGSLDGLASSQSGGTLNFNGDIYLVPGERVGVVVLTNTRNLWDSLLPVTTAGSIAMGVAHRVAGWNVPASPALTLWQSYLPLDLLAAGLVFYALFRLWRLVRSRRGAAVAVVRAAPGILFDIGLSTILLVGLPAFSHQRWDYLLSAQPDLSALAFGAGLVLLLGGVTRAVRALRQRAPHSGVPVRA
jgi:CubicO group peptidase (beta-lactamase class C family)